MKYANPMVSAGYRQWGKYNDASFPLVNDG
jgi:hypothetical protein